MTFVTDSGLTSSQVDTNGVRKWADVTTLGATDLTKAGQDAQAAEKYDALPGILTGGECLPFTLSVTIPAGTSYFARQVWYTSAIINFAVGDNQVSYLWCCSDGIVRSTASAGTLPSSFDVTTCCLLCKATALGGVVTVDNTVQQRARYANPTLRAVTEGSDFFAGVMDTIPAGVVGVVGPVSQVRIYDKLTVQGRLVINGKVRIA